MKLTKNIVLLLVLIVLLSIATAKAQSIDPRAISTAGKIFTAGGFSMSTTFGEMTMVKTFSSGLYSLTQGFQQPNLLMSGVDRFIELPVLISLFPNPANDALYINSVVIFFCS